MRPLVISLTLVLALAAGRRLPGQTSPPGGPYGGPAPAWAPQDTAAGSGAGSVPLPGPSATMRLPPRGAPRSSGQRGVNGNLPSVVTVAGSLAAVLGLFLVVAWALRRTTPAESALLPGEVVEVLGRKVLSPRQQLHLLRCGRKLLLVSLTPDSAETLTEITDPEEVDRLAGLCRQSQPGSATATFRHVLSQLSADRLPEGRRHG